MTKPVWTPSPKQITQSQLTQFMQWLKKNEQAAFTDYESLHTWSVTYPEKFWPAVAKFCEVEFSHSPEQIMVNSDKMLETKWFVGAQFNFAEQQLRHSSDKSAIVYVGENKETFELSFNELKQQVIQLAATLRELGVTQGDRVAGFLPNRPETIIAMLATTSIGAIWSSCSPDFGFHAVFDRFRQITPKILFASDGHQYHGKKHSALKKVAKLQQQISSIEHTIIVPHLTKNPDLSTLTSVSLFQDCINKNVDNFVFAQLPFNHPVYILFSSGTTGIPKCIVHGAGGTLLQHLKEHVLHTNLTTDDRLFYFTTCGWMMWNWLVSGLASGATLVLYDGSPLYPKPTRLFHLIDQTQISVFGTSAKYLSAIEKTGLKPIKTYKLTSLRCILSTGSPLVSRNYDYVYQKIKQDVQLSSISGGTDIISCFALGNPNLPVFKGELQCIGLGMNVQIFDKTGQSVKQQKGELVCVSPFPSMPICFWNDVDNKKYHDAYFDKYPNVWAHGDFAEITAHGGLIIYGRSDAVLNPGGVRIGTAEIYREVEKFKEIEEAIVVGHSIDHDEEVILFIKLQPNATLTTALKKHIRDSIKQNISPHHVPKKIIAVDDIPRTVSGKIVELAVKNVIHGLPVENKDAIANPESLGYFQLGND